MSMRLAVLGCWLLGLIAALALVLNARYAADLSGFLPGRPTALQRLLIEQLRDGPAARTVMLALEGGTASARAALSREIAARLHLDARFSSVANGERAAADADERFVYEHRYLLSDAVDPARFEPTRLRRALEETVDELASTEGPWLKSLVPHDPTGETLGIVDRLGRSPKPLEQDGVWVSRDGARTLLLAQMAAPGSDLDAAAAALAALREAFATAVRRRGPDAAGVRLELSGPPVFAVASRTQIEQAAVRLSLAGGMLVLGVLLGVYRSVGALLLGLAPVVTGAIAGLAAVALGYGIIHGTTLGFGSTLIGESVDYSIYYFVGASALTASAWRHELWPTVRLGMLVSVCGFASLLPVGFPGLSQLGVYSIGGLLAAAAVTRFVLPALKPAHLSVRDLSSLGTRCARLLTRLEPARQLLRLGALVLAALAVGVLIHAGNRLWAHELSALSPIPAPAQRLDAELRTDLGAADVPDLIIVSAPDLERALEGAERVARALSPLIAARMIGAVETPTDYLPSLEAQRARRASLPEPSALDERLRTASAGLPLDARTLEPFVTDVAAARSAPLLTPASLRGTSLEAGFRALTLEAPDHVAALLPLHAADPAHPAIDVARVSAALAPLEKTSPARIHLLDLKAESDALYENYLRAARRGALLGFLAIAVLIAVARRSVARMLRVLLPLGLAVLTVAAALALSARQLTLMHLVGLLLIVAVGSNYALFFDAGGAHPGAAQAAPAPHTLAALVIASACTVMGFGLLMLSGVPVLTALGVTVAPGTLLALIFSALLIDPARAVRSEEPI